MSVTRRQIYTGDTGNQGFRELQAGYNYMLRYTDARIYNNLILTNSKAVSTNDGNVDADYTIVGNGGGINIYPYQTLGSYATDFYETPESIEQRIRDLQEDKENAKGDAAESIQKYIDAFKERLKYVKKFENEETDNYLAPHSLIHPYAIVKFAGAHGDQRISSGSYLFDNFATRKWYEIDGDNLSSYAKTPTTTNIIAWGANDPVGRVPYRFQDFVFCKDWNIIPNNRMITLRRYFAPVSDNIEFDNYKEFSADLIDKESVQATRDVEKTNQSFAPLATAVTYFGEGTDNSLSTILSFSAKYNWEEVEAKSSPIDIEAQANDMGQDFLGNSGTGILSGVMKAMSFMTGFQNAMDGKNDPINNTAQAVPPDPYTLGPYENRILGPTNVIMDTIKRKRGLKFTQDSLKIKFSYIARPIAGINTKAVLLDLLSNILLMCYARGTWFGGIERFRTSQRKMYPFTANKVMNRLYKGQLFGKNGAVRATASQMYDMGTGTNGLVDMFSEALSDMKNLVSSMWNQVMGVVNGLVGNEEEEKARKEKAQNDFNAAISGKMVSGLQSVLAGKILRGAQVPWITGKKALLTGEPVGEWHLTIGNPLNPIAMIGNLVCDGVTITWSDELGPDDFPIGFDAEITLKHALGRDRDAIESMFNRGYGRIYSLPATFSSSADFESKIDKYTGGQTDARGRLKYDEWSATYFGGGGANLGDMENSPLANSGSTFPGLKHMNMYTSKDPLSSRTIINPVVITTPFQMQWNL